MASSHLRSDVYEPFAAAIPIASLEDAGLPRTSVDAGASRAAPAAPELLI